MHLCKTRWLFHFVKWHFNMWNINNKKVYRITPCTRCRYIWKWRKMTVNCFRVENVQHSSAYRLLCLLDGRFVQSINQCICSCSIRWNPYHTRSQDQNINDWYAKWYYFDMRMRHEKNIVLHSDEWLMVVCRDLRQKTLKHEFFFLLLFFDKFQGVSQKLDALHAL